MAVPDKFKSPGGGSKTPVRPKSEGKPSKPRTPAFDGSASVGKLSKKKAPSPGGTDVKKRRASEGSSKKRTEVGGKLEAAARSEGEEEEEEEEEEAEEVGQGEDEELEEPALPDNEVEAIVEVDGKELVKVLQDLRESVADVRVQIQGAKAKVEGGRMPTANGVTYLEVKLQLLLSYCASLALYLSLKARGVSVVDHPVIEKLVEVRAYMEKLRPLDAKLKYQIDKLLKTPAASSRAGGAEASADPLRFKPNPDALMPGGLLGAGDGGEEDDNKARRGRDDDGEAKSGVYRAPKLSAVHFEDKEEAKVRRSREKAAARASKSEAVMAMREEFGDAPMLEANIGTAAQVTILLTN
ncbi:Sas10/Utp3/C1D family-domain-containing protein [Baffinella frigidus]|nr:Sas10/Utp3/C1D family-domain-containing protein [Cryptophyta sp. CCMP2293]